MKPALIATLALVPLLLPAQGVSRGPNRIGLDIETVTLKDSAVVATFRNKTDMPIEAFVVNIAATYSNGEQTSRDTIFDFFDTLGLERLDLPTNPSGALAPKSSRVLAVPLPGASPSSVRVTVTTLMFPDGMNVSDPTAPGQPERVREILAHRDVTSAEVVHWCASMDQIAGGRFTKKAYTELIGSVPVDANAIATAARKSLSAAVQNGISWAPDGTGFLRPATSEAINAQCATSREYYGRKELAKTP
jgi:hypothetical protein